MFKIRLEGGRFEDGRPAFRASCPALKGCHTWGHTPDEALATMRDAIELYVEDLLKAGDTILAGEDGSVLEIDSVSVVA